MLLLLVCFVAWVGTLTAQQVAPGITAIPPNIVARVDPKAKTASSGPSELSSGTAPLARLNQELPAWIRFSFIERMRFEGYRGLTFKTGSNYDDDYLLNRFRFGMLLQPRSWVKVYSEVQDTRALWRKPPVSNSDQTTWDLRQAFIELGGGEGRPFSLRVGRQEVNFGAGRLIARSDWRNGGRTYDAVVATLKESRFRVSAFSLSVVNLAGNGLSHHRPGNVVHGLYGGIDNIVPNSVVEPYVFWRLAAGFRTDDNRPAKLNGKTAGVRWAGMVTTRVEYAAEFARQLGGIGGEPIRAWALYTIGAYTFTSVRTKPRFFLEYNFASGDSTPKDGRHGTFDQLYPSVHDRHGLADQIGWQNIKVLRAGGRFFASRHWALAGIYNDFHLASATDALYNASAGVVARDPSGKSGTHVGQELDAETSYRICRDIEVGAGIGHIFPGGFLKATTAGRAYTYPYFMLNFSL